jgi:hypothetical protein
MLEYESQFEAIIACCHSEEDLVLYKKTKKSMLENV